MGRLILFLIVLVLVAISLPAVAADFVTITDDVTDEVVLLTPKKMHSRVAVQTIPGFWPHGGHRDEDASFFDEEDTAYEQWLIDKKHKQQQKQQQRQEAEGERRQGSAAGRSRRSSLGDFSQASIKARADARRKRLRELNNYTNLKPMWDIIYSDADHVRELLTESFLFSPNVTTERTSEGQYLSLLRDAFSHTVRNMTTEKGRTWVTEFIFALPYPMLLEGEAVERLEREMRSIQEDLRRVEVVWRSRNVTMGANENNNDTDTLSRNKGPSTNTTATEIREALREAEMVLSSSRRAHQMVLALAAPMLPHIRDKIAVRLQEVEAKIVSNDESTAVLRQELKTLTKAKKSLKTTKEQIAKVDRQLRKAVYSNTLLPKDAFITALALIARVRLGRYTGLEGVDSIQEGELSAALTGALGTELKHVLCYPLGMGILVAAAVSWVLLAAREYWLKRVRRSVTQRGDTSGESSPHRQGGSFVRLGLRLNLLMEAVMPLFIPAVILFRTFDSTSREASAYSILLFAQPSQRFALVGVVLALLLVSVSISSLLSRLFFYSSKQQLQRKKRS
ncbi:putative 3-transmembrane protein A13 [Trypanosoma grayi]|uniref:putative 3-transmembrane protein A13 n=1 Tax=Trypanosoma grayi TaxID=71804 RepID=UPI0004F489A6|nr:putative 3-transmembrane protein A13 [Trypanosoma grayi]KEG14976.1 putative 3-transmembrane protein A13 [Trypanosoma grayi]